MTDLDNTQIIAADESFLQNSSTIETEASLRIISGADCNTYHIGKETIIGRANPSDLVISAPSLSKQHAKLTFNNGQCFITDLGSSNKSFHNKIQLQANVCYALHDGDEIKLGDVICSFQEQKSTAINDHTLSEPSHQAYVPVVNTLVEEDSPWPDDDDLPSPIVEETKVDAIPSTQTITDSYDDQEPTQPMKIWNGNSNHINRLSRTSIKTSDDMTSKQNVSNESTANGSSSFVPSLSLATSVDDHDDGSLVIGSSTLPATVPLLIESTQINNDDQLEIVSSGQTKQIVDDDNNTITIETTTTTITTEIEIENTQAYTLEPTSEITCVDTQIAETQPYELESEPIVTDVLQTKQDEVHQVLIDSDTMIEKITTITTTTLTTTVIANENPQLETLAYDLQPTDEPMHLDAPVCADTQVYNLDEQIDHSSTDTVTTTPVEPKQVTDNIIPHEQVEIAVVQDTLPNEHMEIEQTDCLITIGNNEQPTNTDHVEPISATIIADEKILAPVDEQPGSSNKTEDAVISTTNDEEMLVDEKENSIVDIPPTTTIEQEITPDSNQSTAVLSSELDVKATEPTIGTTVADEVSTSAVHVEEHQPATESEEEEVEGGEEEEEEEEKPVTEKSGPVSGRGRRGVARRNARRVRGRRGAAATRARVVSTRIYGGRRNAVLPSTIDTESNNATLEETIQTESEESPTKATITPPDVEPKSDDTQPITPVLEGSTNETSSSSQTTTNPGSNIRVSARIKARASSGRTRQFPYADDYVDLDDLEKQSKAPNAPASTSATARKSARGGRGSSTPQKRISLRQQPIDAADSPDEKANKEKDQTNVYEHMDTGGENEEPVLSTTNKTGGRKRKSTTPVATVTTKRTRSTTTPANITDHKQTSDLDPISLSNTTTPKRGRKSTKLSTPIESSAEPAISTDDRPVRIALSSHLNFEQNHLDTLQKLGFEIMDESCRVDALVVDRIRRTKKFFMCLARGAHILSPAWIEAMTKDNRYIPYDKYYLEDVTAETRYGFQLRESVRLAKQHPLFENYRVFCTKDTSPPYDDLKDIVEAAGGKFIDKLNTNKPGKDLICIVGQSHKNEYEDLFKKGVPIVSEEFALSGISKQKLDFESFSLFQNASTAIKTTGTK